MSQDKTSNPVLERLAAGLSSRILLAGLAGVFVLDLVVPDLLFMVDEIVLGLATILLARWQARRRRASEEDEPPVGAGPKPPPKNVTPGR